MDKLKLITIDQVAEMTQLSKSCIYKQVAARLIPCFKIGNQLRFKVTEIERWLEGKRRGTQEEAENYALAHVLAHPIERVMYGRRRKSRTRKTA